LPVRVDGRGEELMVIRPVHSQRAMTAAPAPLPANLVAELLQQVARFPQVSAVALDVTTKPPATIEWE
jgi:GMP synthase PP-ATPase subunit